MGTSEADVVGKQLNAATEEEGQVKEEDAQEVEISIPVN